MIKLSIFLVLCQVSSVLGQELISANNFNTFKNEKISELQSQEELKIQNKSLLTNQITRANSRQIYSATETINYANNSWFNLNSLNLLGAETPLICETTFNTSNGATVGGKFSYFLNRESTYNEASVAKAGNVSFTARKTTITSVLLQIVSRTGHTTPNIQFRITGDDSSATFNTRCIKILENL